MASEKRRGIVSKLSDEAQISALAAQRKKLRELADRIERGEQLDEGDAELVAFVLRGVADITPETPLRGRGTPDRKANADDVALVFAKLVSTESLSDWAAQQRVADMFEMSGTAVKKILAKRTSEGDTYAEKGMRVWRYISRRGVHVIGQRRKKPSSP